jgi:predicted GNAT family acetyltransferase
MHQYFLAGGRTRRIDAMPPTLRNNKSKSRFELEIDDHVAFVEYTQSPGGITLLHTEVPKELGGRGVGSILAKAVLENVRAQGLKVEPRCEFLAGYIKKHPEFGGLVN